jgi:NAD(P)-dependent dehydrogenase (short-subunit alcohol dehydrogenase family)
MVNAQPKVVVITGSTRGIGLGLAQEFLARGCRVVISGRSNESVDRALSQLRANAGDRLVGIPCDVTNYEQLQALWDGAKAAFGRVDIWINNAAAMSVMRPIVEQDPKAFQHLIQTNLIGVFNASQIVLKGMGEQGFGHLYNMEGSGSDGRVTVGMTPYGTSKAALTFFTKSLIKEMKDSPVKVSFLSPGIVITDMWTDLYAGQPERWERSKRFLNILADKVETVTPWLAEKVLANERGGAKIAWLTTPKILGRFVTLPFNKRQVIA